MAIRSPTGSARRPAPTAAGPTCSPTGCRRRARNGRSPTPAISGNRVLSPGMGESALARFDEDVLSLPNVKYMIVFEGVNDIGNRFGPPRGRRRPGVPRPRPAADHRRADDRRLQADHRPRPRQGHQGDRQPDRPVQGRRLLVGGRRGRAPGDQRLDPQLAARSTAWSGSTPPSPIPADPRADARRLSHGRPPPRQRRRAEGGRRIRSTWRCSRRTDRCADS